MVILSNNEIAEIIYSLIKEKDTKSLVAIMEKLVSLEKNRLVGKSETLIVSLREMIHKQQGIIEVVLKSAIPLDDDQKEELGSVLKKRFDANQIIFKEIIDKNLIGGFKIEVNNEIIDVTLRSQISKLKEHLTSKI
jgi:F-type H+-transporting ATPase subunit delta